MVSRLHMSGGLVVRTVFLVNTLVPVPHNFGSGPTFLVPSSSVGLVPSIFIPLDRGGCTVIINANHCKTCICKRIVLLWCM
jgi:hypothetical protein